MDYASFLSIDIPNYDYPDKTMGVLMGEIESYQGVIFRIRYISYGIETIVRMYEAKYGAVEPWVNESEDSEYCYTSTIHVW